MQLTRIKQLNATLVLKSGLHIGAGDTEMRIGGTDSPVIKNPLNDKPYIPGSSLKGKIRSLLEWRLGLVGVANGQPFSFQHLRRHDTPEARDLLRLFGGAPGGDVDDLVRAIGPTRIAFWDCALNADWLAKVEARHLLVTEAKSENRIDRITGVAEHPRFIERVIAGAEFDFRLSLKVINDEELLPLLLRGLKLLEADSLGGSGSRGYGKLALRDTTLDGRPIQADLDATDAFVAVA